MLAAIRDFTVRHDIDDLLNDSTVIADGHANSRSKLPPQHNRIDECRQAPQYTSTPTSRHEPHDRLRRRQWWQTIHRIRTSAVGRCQRGAVLMLLLLLLLSQRDFHLILVECLQQQRALIHRPRE